MGAKFRNAFFVSMLIVFFAQPAEAQWTQCAGPEGGWVNGLVDGGTALYAATATQVYTFDKGTQRWQTFGAPFPGKWLQAVAVSGGTVLVGVANGEIHRSSDGGATWTMTGTGLGSIYQFATTPSAIFAAAGAKLVIKSTDDGVTWSESGSGLDGGAVEALIADAGRIFASTNSGVFRSDDEGGSWTKVADIGRMYSFFIDGTTIWAGGYQKVYRSTDDGATWTMMAGSMVFSHRVLSIARTSTYLYAGATDGGIARSSDDGATWEEVNTNLPDLRIYGLVADGATVYAGTSGGGVYMLSEPATDWTPMNEGMYATIVRGLQTMGTMVFAATRGRGIMAAEAADLDSWSERNGGFPSAESFCITRTGETLLIGGSSGDGLYRTSDAGMNWVKPTSGLQNELPYSFYVRGQDVFAGMNSSGLFHSLDAGDSWTRRGDSISKAVVFGITALGTKLFVATLKQGVLMSSDEGVNWVPVNEGLGGNRINAIHTHGGSLFAGVNDVATYRSTDEGLTWTTLGGPINGQGAQCFLSIGTQLFVGSTGGGFFRSTDNGETWVAMSDGLPSESVYALSTHDDMLLAGVNYFAVWKRPLSEVILGIEETTPSPHVFRLHPVAPQPLRDRGTARFDLDAGADVRLDVYDLLGRHVSTIAASRYAAGSHAVAFDALGLRTGSYLLRLQAGGMQAAQRVTVIR